MAITSTGLNAATNVDTVASTAAVDKTVLGKDDFMTLLLVELQHQDPTEPMDSEKILTQTSQLAGLESAENTNKALESLAASLSASQNFSSISAIGKTADLGSNAIAHDEGTPSSFEVYFPQEIQAGTLEILDSEGTIVSTMNVDPNPAGTYQFDWDGTLTNGNAAESGVYYVTSSYTNPAGEAQTTRMGTYPIEAVRFENGSALVKVGSNYVPLENIVEVY
ncbi:flagellar hook capping protein [Sulfurimonas gotlandica GD1]|uniref:Basal-body rod modification protein FlgD n=1 Tax=Sulfurimonas gotlandica (strain DSM 19862 / JCM 16533 / GD1) TaxID=929558 RepID=B6BH24_SULGG|nr:FlgD immunoglobulin-like domain containing protein [Sulfurimonas gotlandica]EDZ63062.1 flagellar hook capping protein [Sulfurimonas gotlandica GD1]EHP29811.1 flagellar hook capping protein [Sulfurimonas gotlandica GD1]